MKHSLIALLFIAKIFSQQTVAILDFEGIGECGTATNLPSRLTGTCNSCAILSTSFNTFTATSVSLSSNSTLDITLQFNGLTSENEGIYFSFLKMIIEKSERWHYGSQ